MNRILVTLISLFSCTHINSEVFPVEFIKVNSYITIHKSYDIFDGYKTSSNGLLIETSQSVILIDTAWNNEETMQILDYIKKNIQKK